MPKITDQLLDRVKQPKSSHQRTIIRDTLLSGFQVVVSSRSIVFRYQCSSKGHRITRTLGRYPVITSKAAREMVFNGDDRGLFQSPKLSSSSVESLESIAELLKRYTKDKQLSEATIKSMHKSYMQGLSDWLDKYATSLTAQAFESVYRSMLDRGIESSARMLARYVRAVYRWAELPDPTEKLTKNTGHSANKIVARDRRIESHQLPLFKTVMSQLTDGQRLAIMTALVTGMRKSELQSITANSLDHANKSIKLPKTKNGKSHQIPLPESLWLSLVAVSNEMQPDSWLLSVGDHLPKAFTRLIPLSWHDCRRTCASMMAANGEPEALIKTILNHVDKRNVTQAHYLRFDLEKQREALGEIIKKLS
jgi:integrase